MEGVEPPTAWFVARYSIQLSYMRVLGTKFQLEAERSGIIHTTKDIVKQNYR